MTKRQRILIFAAAGLSLLTIVGTMSWFTYVGFTSVTKQKPTTEAEKKLVITAAALQDFGLEVENPDSGKFSTIRQMDGSRVITYELNDSGTFINSTTNVFKQPFTARQTFHIQKLGMKSALGVTRRIQVIDSPALLTVGEERYAALLKNEKTGELVGNIFIVRQGGVVHALTLVGFYFDEAEAVADLFGALLRESAAQRKR